jgi:hypothetical protein
MGVVASVVNTAVKASLGTIVQVAPMLIDATVKVRPGHDKASDEAYRATLQQLSDASTHGPHFEAFKDIAWDAPRMRVDDSTTWVLPDIDPLAKTEWFRSLPAERQSEVARIRIAAMIKTGSQFEQLLLLGGTQFLMGLGNENPEFRYFMHELTEETHHIQMFQEFTNRVAPEIHGCPSWLLDIMPTVANLGSTAPAVFFQIILAGEEPIDHVQKSIMRSGGTFDLLDRIMQIHIAEEARHIGFAHAWLEQYVPGMDRRTKYVMGLLTPLIMRIGFTAIMVPSRQDAELMGVPAKVMRQAYSTSNPAFAKLLSDSAADVRALCEQTGLLNVTTRWAWKALGVDGRASRYRAEPAPAAVAA